MLAILFIYKLSIIESKNTIEFSTVAAEYCSFLRQSEQVEKKKYLEILQKILPLLYLKGSLLSRIEPSQDSEILKFVTEADYNFILEKLGRQLAENDIYIEIIEPISRRNFDSTQALLSECLSDIYQELSDFIQLFRVGDETAMADSLWECQQSFEQYWGPRVVSALSAIHGILYGKEEIISSPLTE